MRREGLQAGLESGALTEVQRVTQVDVEMPSVSRKFGIRLPSVRSVQHAAKMKSK